MKKIFAILCVMIFFVSCKNATDDESDGSSNFDSYAIVSVNTSVNSDFDISDINTSTCKIYTRSSGSSGILGTWRRYTKAYGTFNGSYLDYVNWEKIDTFNNDGSYTVSETTYRKSGDTLYGVTSSNYGTYILTKNGSIFELSTLDKNSITESLTYIVSTTYLLMTNK